MVTSPLRPLADPDGAATISLGRLTLRGLMTEPTRAESATELLDQIFESFNERNVRLVLVMGR